MPKIVIEFSGREVKDHELYLIKNWLESARIGDEYLGLLIRNLGGNLQYSLRVETPSNDKREK